MTCLKAFQQLLDQMCMAHCFPYRSMVILFCSTRAKVPEFNSPVTQCLLSILCMHQCSSRAFLLARPVSTAGMSYCRTAVCPDCQAVSV